MVSWDRTRLRKRTTAETQTLAATIRETEQRMKLKIDWREFTDKIDFFLENADSIIDESQLVRTKKHLNEIKREIASWSKDCYKFLEDSFEVDKEVGYNEISSSFNNSYGLAHEFGKRYKDDEVSESTRLITDLLHDEVDDVKAKCNTLKYYKTLLKVSDAIIKPDMNLEYRNQYSTEQVLDLILQKLYNVYGSYQYPVLKILEWNGVFLKRREEHKELVEILQKKGYVKSDGFDFRDLTIQLTAKGKIYVEKLEKKRPTDYSHIDKSKKELDRKIDEVKNELWKLGLGQEIIFEELEELKSLYTKVDKKTWGQVLKGKLIDLGLSELISTDTMNFIYKELTNEILRLK